MQIHDFRPLNKNTLRGFFTLELDSGLVIKECSVHESNDKQWFSFPGRPMIDRDGRALRDERGKTMYAGMITVEPRARMDKLQAMVLAALKPHMDNVPV